ncbi:hypothetical protein HPP92_021520 [Vanilla planifolia]|uniref:Uncharacterized protein n=1 Tax=Vanilla planifolia TaxID=51239 RepID=A0A835UH94_VANPL|nr:hypothetical protein HPP92_021885 [Vanilla planifolia]KAG0463044.1 hypothetical protein HPP92_021520 [Vanilla planifolia]
MDPELLNRRRRTQDYIIQLLQRRSYNPSSDVMQRIPELARHLEERIYKDVVLKGEDYTSMSSAAIEQRLQGIMKMLNNSQQSHYVSSSAANTMIPTPGIGNYGNKVPAPSQDIALISTVAVE